MKRSLQGSRLPRYLRDIQREIERHAKSAGLDFYTIVFEVLSFEEMNEVASYGGFPKRYPHWRFGMEFERMTKSGAYGLHRIYEMVINNDPCYAYLLEGNSLVDQKMVMAHVMGHCDFFKNNMFFAHTSRKMMDDMANHGSRISGYMDRFGRDKVEAFVDACLSVDNLIDPIRAPGIGSPSRKGRPGEEEKREEEKDDSLDRFPSYMRPFMAKPEAADAADGPGKEDEGRRREIPVEEYGQDVLGFLLDHAPLDGWEQSVLSTMREEAYYFVPQAQTKIMNEGWATYWHSRIMTEKILTAADVVDYADHASGVLATHGNQVNPYKLGVELFRHVKERWDLGRFGKDWEECTDAAARATWDTRTMQGEKKVFEVRTCYNDVTFIDEFFTPDFCEEQGLFTYGYVDHRKRWEILSRSARKVKKVLLQQLTNLGNPVILVRDANHANQGELLLEHRHDGTDLRLDWARDTLKNVVRIWKRPVRLATVAKEKSVHLRYDGRDHQILEQGDAPKKGKEGEEEGD